MTFDMLPWDQWKTNVYAKTQMEDLQRIHRYLTKICKLTPQLIAQVFKVHYDEDVEYPRIFDAKNEEGFWASNR